MATEYYYDFLDRLTKIYDNGNRIAAYECYPDGMVKQVKAGQDQQTVFLRCRPESQYLEDCTGWRFHCRQYIFREGGLYGIEFILQI